MRDFQLTLDTLGGKARTPDGKTFTLLTEAQERLWRTHGAQRMLMPPDPPPDEPDPPSEEVHPTNRVTTHHYRGKELYTESIVIII